MFDTKMYTPEEVATMLKLSKNTIYKLIDRGEIIAKRIGNNYRIPATSLSFVFNGLDADLYSATTLDECQIANIHLELDQVRKKRYETISK